MTTGTEPRGAAGPTASPPRLWTVEAANARLPGLREVLARMKGWASRLAEVHTELGRLASFWGDELNARDQPDHGLSGRLEAEWGSLTRRLDESIASLRTEGIEVKQIDSGLVDFPAKVDGQIVYLCWRLEESEVGFYHTIEGGFAGRRPLPSRPRTVPTGARESL
jgi:hypothetical protein